MAKKKANGKGGALVYLVLDKSGSMSAIRDASIDGCNRFINETREANPEALISLMVFDTSVNKVYSAKSLADIEPVDKAVYSPGGGTALLDAVGHAIKDIDEMKDQPSKVVVAILTDGQENSSHEYTRAAVQASVAQREKEKGWQFLFLGANLDSFAEAGAIGMKRSGSSSNWRQDSTGTQAVYAMASSSTNSYLRGATPTADVGDVAYASFLTQAEADPAKATTGQTEPTAKTTTGKVTRGK